MRFYQNNYFLHRIYYILTIHFILDKVRKMLRTTFRIVYLYVLTHPWRHTHIQ